MSWWNWNGIPARLFLKLDDVVDNGALLFASPVDSRFPSTLWQLFHGNNDYLYDIPCRWATPWIDCKEPQTVKKFFGVMLDFDDYAGGMTIEWEVDDGVRSGGFLAKVPTDMAWGDTGSNIDRLWNDASGTVVNGLFWTERKVRSIVYRLPQEALGRRIRFILSAASTGNTPPAMNDVGVMWGTRKNLYPAKAEA